MSGELAMNDIVTEFLLSTCQLRAHPSKYDIQAAMYSSSFRGKGWHCKDKDSECVPLISGSAAEFYIEPMLPHVGDIDIMFYGNTQLALPRGYPPPTKLPAEFNSYIQVYEIIDSDLPGYVHLELRYLLTQCVDDGKYNAVDYDRGQYLKSILIIQCHCGRHSVHGPAKTSRILHNRPILLPVDHVPCLLCPLWPPQAADWPTRHRNYGWPDSSTLGRVVSNGCSVKLFPWHIVRVNKINGWAGTSGDYHSHKPKLC